MDILYISHLPCLFLAHFTEFLLSDLCATSLLAPLVGHQETYFSAFLSWESEAFQSVDISPISPPL